MKYEVKGLTSYGVYDGDRLCGTYESEKAATLVAEALNEEAGRGEAETALVTPGFERAEATQSREAYNDWIPNGHAPQETD